jgi:pSer/pThr/pTyr-binding forkhead associated (FHA) protein
MDVTLAVIEGPHQGRVFSFHEHDNFVVGRAKYAHFRLPLKDKYFSRLHFMVEVNPPLCRLLDMGSTNGTWVNTRRVKAADLQDGDLIKGGLTTIRVSIERVDTGRLTGSVGLDDDRLDPEDLHALAVNEPEPAVDPAWIPIEPSAADPYATVPSSPPRLSAEPGTPELMGVASGSPLASSLRADAYDAPGAIPELPPLPSPGPRLLDCQVCGCQVPTQRRGEVVRSADQADFSLCGTCLELIRKQPQPFAGYQIVRELGRGGMGVVSLALRLADGTCVALKTIIPQVAATKTDIERFLREVRILSALDHPNIVRFREAGESTGRFYFAMDHVSGIDAHKLLKSRGPLPIDRAVDLACQLLEALEYAHARQFVHRDIKPSNLLVKTNEGRDQVLLSDFGLARMYQASQISGLTMIGEAGGTPAFMAPEQITHFREARPASDLYSTGATLYTLLTDRLVFDFPHDLGERFRTILERDPVSIRSRRKDIPHGLATVIHRSIAREAEKRFPGARAMREALVKSIGKR